MTLILEKDKLIESIWEYRWYILQHRTGFVAKIIRKTQYKETRGKHIEVAPRDIIKAKKQGLSEWFNLRRGYKGVFKWYVMDLGKHEEPPKAAKDYFEDRRLDSFEYIFGAKDLQDFQTISELNLNNLIGLNFALITFLSRNQPLKKSTFAKFYRSRGLEQELQFHFMKELNNVDINKIKQKLRDWIDDDEHQLDNELALSFFKSHFAGGESGYIRDIEHHCFNKQIKAKSEKKELWWMEKVDICSIDYSQLKEQADKLWKNNKRINTKKIRTEYLQSIGIDLEEISYKPKN